MNTAHLDTYRSWLQRLSKVDLEIARLVKERDEVSKHELQLTMESQSAGLDQSAISAASQSGGGLMGWIRSMGAKRAQAVATLEAAQELVGVLGQAVGDLKLEAWGAEKAAAAAANKFFREQVQRESAELISTLVPKLQRLASLDYRAQTHEVVSGEGSSIAVYQQHGFVRHGFMDALLAAMIAADAPESGIAITDRNAPSAEPARSTTLSPEDRTALASPPQLMSRDQLIARIGNAPEVDPLAGLIFRDLHEAQRALARAELSFKTLEESAANAQLMISQYTRNGDDGSSKLIRQRELLRDIEGRLPRAKGNVERVRKAVQQLNDLRDTNAA